MYSGVYPPSCTVHKTVAFRWQKRIQTGLKLLKIKYKIYYRVLNLKCQVCYLKRWWKLVSSEHVHANNVSASENKTCLPSPVSCTNCHCEHCQFRKSVFHQSYVIHYIAIYEHFWKLVIIFSSAHLIQIPATKLQYKVHQVIKERKLSWKWTNQKDKIHLLKFSFFLFLFFF